MKKLLWTLPMVCTAYMTLYGAENNQTTENNVSKKALQKAIELEKKYAKEQRFYQGSEYDLKSKEFDPELLKKVPAIEPDYDFDMDTGVYDD